VRSRHAFFNESNIHSDSEVCLEFLENHDFGFVHQVLTGQGVRPDSLTSHSGMLQTYLPWILYELVKYGPKYLSKEELRQRINEHTWSYYRYLGEQAFKWRGREFWSYHRQELANLGRPLSATQLTAHALSYVLDLVFNRNLTGKFMRQRNRMWPKQLNLRY
jgi:hypothetical protein